MTLESDLRAGAEVLGLALSDEQVAKLLAYLGLLQKWGKVYNLTALREQQDMLSRHVLDSLAVVPPLHRHTGGRALRLLDVGSGAGLPGAVIAVCCPAVQVDCLDAVAKKAAFVQQSAATLQLSNLRGIHGRVEQVRDTYDVVSSRAFASLADFVEGSLHSLAPAGIWLAMKGKRPEAEIAAVPATATVFHVEQLTVPGLDAQRCIVWMERAAEHR
ncbi:MAG: 16S rRNA (guanine(527)-N(7))-methyltransferase RsmG [Ramlibacter sp.]